MVNAQNYRYYKHCIAVAIFVETVTGMNRKVHIQYLSFLFVIYINDFFKYRINTSGN